MKKLMPIGILSSPAKRDERFSLFIPSRLFSFKLISLLLSAVILTAMSSISADAEITYSLDEAFTSGFGTVTQRDAQSAVHSADTVSAVPGEPNGVLTALPFTGQTGLQNNPGSTIFTFNNPNSAITMELKFKTDNIIAGSGTRHDFFQTRDDAGTSSPYILRYSDDGKIRFNSALGIEADNPIVGAYSANVWSHMFLVLRGDPSGTPTAEVYIDGVKNHAGALPVRKAAAGNNIKNLIIFATSIIQGTPQQVWWDDYAVRTLDDLTLMRSTIQNGAQNVTATTRGINLKFNTILDSTSIPDIKVLKNNEELTSGVTVSRVHEDASRLKVVFDSDLEYNANYKIDYSALKDVLGTSSAVSELAFSVEGQPSGPRLIDMTSPRGSEVAPALVLSFDKSLNPSVSEYSSISSSGKAKIAAAVLSNSNQTLTITFAHKLQAGKTYAVTLGANSAGANGLPLEAIEFTFTTDPTPDKFTDNFDARPTVGANNVFSTKNTPENATFVADGDLNSVYWSNQNGLWVSNAGTAEVTYYLENGIYSADLYAFEAPSGNTNKVEFYASEDGVDFERVEHIIIADNVHTLSNQTSPEKYDQGFTVTNTYSSENIPAGAKYFKFALNAQATWRTKLFRLTLNGRGTPSVPTLLASVPSNGEIKAVAGNTIALTYSAGVYTGSVTADCFSLIGGATSAVLPVVGTSVDASGKNITLTLAANLESQANYTLTIEPKLEDIYGNIIGGGTIAFRTQKPVTLKDAVLKSGSVTLSALQTGTVTPVITVNSATVGNTVLAVACLYNGRELAGISVASRTNLAAGDTELVLDAVLVPSVDCVLKMYIMDAPGTFRPLSDVVKISSDGSVKE